MAVEHSPYSKSLVKVCLAQKKLVTIKYILRNESCVEPYDDIAARLFDAISNMEEAIANLRK